MNRRIRRALGAEKRRITKRLAEAVEPNLGGPVLGGGNIRYELAEKVAGISYGGIGAIHRLVQKLGLAEEINERVRLFRVHHPYHESDHVLNLAYNALCGGLTLEDIEHRRNDRVFLDALGARSIPDPTTSGDFLRRFAPAQIDALMDAINETRLQVWRAQPNAFTAETARIDADGSIVPTTGDCKDGMDISYNGIWGYHALVVSLANTGEPLFILNRSANRPSHEGVVPYYDRAVELCRRAGFQNILLRGDTDFSLTREFDRWSETGVRFVFGYDANPAVTEWAESAPEAAYEELAARAERVIKTRPRARPERVKRRIVRERGFENMQLEREDVIEFPYRPGKCRRDYRMIAVRKQITVTRGQQELFDQIRYHFYVTNDPNLSVHEVVQEGRQRCNQENLIQQMKNGVRALRAPVNTLNANWAYMVTVALAWSIKAWAALSLPITPRWKAQHEAGRDQLLRMDFRTFLDAIINVPAQIVRTGRRIVFRILAWRPRLHLLFRLLDAT